MWIVFIYLFFFLQIKKKSLADAQRRSEMESDMEQLNKANFYGILILIFLKFKKFYSYIPVFIIIL